MKTSKPEINPAFVQPARADGSAWWVPSRSSDVCYLVERKHGALSCSCPARKHCCHLRAVEARIVLDAQTDVLASLPRELSGATVSEAEKLETMERDAALPKERVYDRRAPSLSRVIAESMAAKAERALPYSAPEREFSIFASER